MNIQVEIGDGAATQLLDRIGGLEAAPDLAEIIGESCADLLRDWLTRLAQERHRPGQRHNFYLDAADAVISEPRPGRVTLSIHKAGLAQRLNGGVIRPSGRLSIATGRPIRRLAVPIPGTRAEGRVPAEFPGLFPVAVKGDPGRAYLRDESGPLFYLLRSVTQSPDPTVLPSAAAISARAADEIRRWVSA